MSASTAPAGTPRRYFEDIYAAGVIRTADHALNVLHGIDALRARLVEQEDYAALRARQLGATWEQIGAALGITRQAAHQRWGAVADFATRTEGAPSGPI
jgi:hypothetical protein